MGLTRIKLWQARLLQMFKAMKYTRGVKSLRTHCCDRAQNAYNKLTAPRQPTLKVSWKS